MLTQVGNASNWLQDACRQCWSHILGFITWDNSRYYMMSKSGKIGLTDLTMSWLEKQLQECLVTTSTIKEWIMQEFGEGKGYASQVLQVCITWEPENEKLPSSFVLKVPSMKPFEKLVKTGAVSREMKQLVEEDNFKSILSPVS